MQVKTLLPSIAIVCLFSFILACETQTDPAAQELAPTITTAQLDTLPLDTAISYANGWQQNLINDTTIFDGRNVFAFKIPRADFENLLEATKNTTYDFRAYLGYKDSIQEGENHFELMLVAVDNNGDDVINANNFIYDFTTPCPDQCDDTSPLCGACK